MRGKIAKKIRKEVQKSEVKVAEKAVQDFKMFVRTLPFRARLALCYKILRGLLCLILLFNTRPANAELSSVELDSLQVKIIRAESSGNPKAIGDFQGRARGLCQINRPTWKRFSKYPWEDAFDAEKNLQVGRAILEHISEVYGSRASIARVAFSYNTGRYCFHALPSWTQNCRNKIYLSIYKNN